jgi:hypothetical protein
METPIMCGIVALKPKLAPEAATIALFGPGVRHITMANDIADGNHTMSDVVIDHISRIATPEHPFHES